MTCSVNLLPVCRLDANTRARRRAAWLVSNAALAALLAAAWLHVQMSDRIALRVHEELSRLQTEREDLERRGAAMVGRSRALAEEGALLERLYRDQSLPLELQALSAAAPPGVVLTEFRAKSATVAARPPEGGASPGAREAPPGSTIKPAKPVKQETLVLEVSGFALNHDAIRELIDVMTSAAGWTDVILFEATRQPLLAGEAILFRIRGRTEAEPA